MNKLLSVVVPVYNVEMYLDRCIDSIVNQTYNDIEIILVDDGSLDDSGKICDAWRCKDERIKVIHKTNGGLSDARNKGLEIAKGEFISFIDSDDYIELDTYRRMITSMIDNQADIACCGRCIVRNNEVIKKVYTINQENIYDTRSAIIEFLTNGVIEESACDKVYRTKLFDNIRFPYGELNEDLATIPNVLLKANRIVHVGDALYNYSQNIGTISKSPYSGRYSVCIKHILDIRKCINDVFDKELDEYISIFEARYATNMATMLLNSGKRNEYKDDYISYYSIIKKNIIKLFKCNNISFKFKNRSLLILLNIYEPIKKIKGKKL